MRRRAQAPEAVGPGSARALRVAPPEPGQVNGKMGPLDVGKEVGTTAIAWVDERTSLTGAGPLGPVPEGPQGDQLVLHAWLVDASSWRCATARRLTRPTVHAVPDQRGLFRRARSRHASLGSDRGDHPHLLAHGEDALPRRQQAPARLNWIIRVVLRNLTMVRGFTGYLLPFDQRSKPGHGHWREPQRAQPAPREPPLRGAGVRSRRCGDH